MRILKMLLAGASFATVVTVAGTANANLVLNGSFDTGDLTDWNVNGNDYFVSTNIEGVTPYPGDSYFASTGCVGNYCDLAQTLATTPGQTYTLSFAFNPGANANAGDADTYVTWGGTEAIDVTQGPEVWTVYTVPGLVASSNATQIDFRGFQDPAYTGIDNVSVTPSVAVPEPSTLSLFSLGFLGLGGLFAYRRRGQLRAKAIT